MESSSSPDSSLALPPPLVPLFAVNTRLTPHPPSFFYQTGLALVAGAMILLPAIYAAFTALAGYGVYYFATHHFASIWDWPVGGRYGFLFKIVCSITPLLIGLIVVLFMVKPLFARQPRRMQPITLNPEHEPLFHALVQRICAIVGAPAPREIRLDCAVNASAGFRRGFLSFFGNDLVLTVGLPLVAGLSMRQLAGVIAHEFGHFRQGAAMRLSYVIRRVNQWFARVVYERDTWDQALAEWSQTDTAWVNLMVGCARAGVWLSRVILSLLMRLGHAICSLLMRQMEYDADRCEIHVAGSEAFEETVFRLGELNATIGSLYTQMNKTWKKSFRLPDNLPLLVGHHAAAIPDAERASLAGKCLAGRTGWLDTHPSDSDRIAAARRAAEPGLMAEADAPAAGLLENFANLGKFVTLAHYEDDLEIPTTEDFLIPVEAVLNPPDAPSAPEFAPIPQAPRWQGPPPDS